MTSSTVMILFTLLMTPQQAFGLSKYHNGIVKNLLSFRQATDLAIFTDKPDISKILDLTKLLAPALIYRISDIAETIVPSPCPVKDDKENHFMPKPFYTVPFGHRQHTVVVYVQDVVKLLAILGNTVTNCTFVYDAGIYHQDSRFLFLVDPEDNAGEYTEKIFNSSPHITKHR